MAIFHSRQTRGTIAAAATIVGGGISCLSATFGFADAGRKSFLIEHSPCSGRRVTHYIHHNRYPNIEIPINAYVISAEGQASFFTVSLRQGQDKELRRCCTSS